MGIPTVTALYGSLNAMFNIALAGLVVRHRGKSGVSIGPGKGEKDSHKALDSRSAFTRTTRSSCLSRSS